MCRRIAACRLSGRRAQDESAGWSGARRDTQTNRSTRARQRAGGTASAALSPFGPQDVRRVLSVIVGVSQRKTCQVLQVSRSVLHERPRRESQRAAGDELLRVRIAQLIEQHPTFGYRRIWALLRFREKLPINRKTVYGVLRRQQWRPSAGRISIEDRRLQPAPLASPAPRMTPKPPSKCPSARLALSSWRSILAGAG